MKKRNTNSRHETYIHQEVEFIRDSENKIINIVITSETRVMPKETKEDVRKRIEWQLKALSQVASDMSENDLDWTIKMEKSYKNKRWLSDREREILDNIYARY